MPSNTKHIIDDYRENIQMKGFVSPVVLIITVFVAFSDPRDSVFKLEWDVMLHNTLILTENINEDISLKLDEIFLSNTEENAPSSS